MRRTFRHLRIFRTIRPFIKSKTTEMRNLLHTILLLAFFLVSISLTSCLKDDTSDVTYYSDCAVQSFSLGTLNRYVKTVSSKTGNDTIVKQTVAGSTYTFSIDHAKREIYNVDSLPAGVDTLHVICNIAAKNGGYIHFKSMQSDSIFYYTSTDSISFEQNPRTIYVTSNDGQYRTSYTVKLNVHKEDADKMTWNAPYTAPEFIDAEQLQATEWKTVSKDAEGNDVTKDSVVVKVAKGDNVKLYTSSVKDGKSWAELTPSMKLSATANIASFDGVLYTNDVNGQVCKSEDGENWTTMELYGAMLGVSNKKLYILQELDGAGEYASSIVSYDISTATETTEPIYGANYCTLILKKGISLCESKKNNKVTGTTLTGVTNAGPCVLYKAENTAEPQKWMVLSNELAQNLPNTYTETVAYGNYLVALSAGKFLTSLDSGRSWQKRYFFHTPSALTTEGNSHLFADSHGMLWIFAPNGQVFTGKLNGVAWEK